MEEWREGRRRGRGGETERERQREVCPGEGGYFNRRRSRTTEKAQKQAIKGRQTGPAEGQREGLVVGVMADPLPFYMTVVSETEKKTSRGSGRER